SLAAADLDQQAQRSRHVTVPARPVEFLAVLEWPRGIASPLSPTKVCLSGQFEWAHGHFDDRSVSKKRAEYCYAIEREGGRRSLSPAHRPASCCGRLSLCSRRRFSAARPPPAPVPSASSGRSP